MMRSHSLTFPLTVFGLVSVLLGASIAAAPPPKSSEPMIVDFRYAPPWWQTCIGLPDDWQKTLVGKDGSLLYDYPGKFSGFGLKIVVDTASGTEWTKQDLASPRVPIVRTIKRSGSIEIEEEAFAVVPSSLSSATTVRERALIERIGEQTGSVPTASNRPPRYDMLIVRFQNTGATEAVVAPVIRLETDKPVSTDERQRTARVGAMTTLVCSQTFEKLERGDQRAVLRFSERAVPAGGQQTLVFCVGRGTNERPATIDLAKADQYHRQAQRYWEKLDLPYDHIEVPDAGVQALIDSSIRNIYQAREIKQGLPAFQVGPTCYRGLWVVDGSFLMEAVAYLGRTEEARKGIRYLLSFQRDDGGFMLIDGHWKETGIVLWAVTRHARLTGDKEWLRSVWPKLEKGFAYVRKMRQMASKDPSAPNYRLIPDGFSDGGLGEMKPEYTNPYWTMAGMRAAVEAARWLGKDAEAADWQREYDDFLMAFRKAAERDMRTDAQGNRYLPIRMKDNEGITPQRAQWAFCHAVFPGKVFAQDAPLVRGNMKMLEATEAEGMVFGTGWIADGIWNYFASFYGHAWLWQGRGDKTAQALYAFANHASPLLCWREEQMPKGKGANQVGDMPHNWASAEFIRLTRHSLVLERGNELHLCEALPAAWLVPGKKVRLQDIETDFGPLSLEMYTTRDGRGAELSLAPPRRDPPARIVLHLDRWSGQRGTLDLPVGKRVRQTIALTPHPQP